MFRRCDHAKGNIETAQEHLTKNLELFLEDHDLMEMLTLHLNNELTKDISRYHVQLNSIFQTLGVLDTVSEMIENLRKILQTT